MKTIVETFFGSKIPYENWAPGILNWQGTGQCDNQKWKKSYKSYKKYEVCLSKIIDNAANTGTIFDEFSLII